ncbi:MAG: DUF4350 domain-containing protein, partial [bacterium]|nr:DUF4350 domain-containing protein [bacterium]
MNHKISAVLLSLMMAGCVYGFYAFFEPYEKTEDLGWDKAALRNPYLAAVYFLQRLDIDARSYDSFEKLQPLPENGAIFVSNSSNVLSARRVDRLIEWVKGGGHLIVAAQPPDSDTSDQLLEFFSIENLTTEYRVEVQPKRGSNADTASAGEERKKGSKKLSEQLREYNRKLVEQITKTGSATEQGEEAAVPGNELSSLQFEGIDRPLKLHFLPSRQLYHPYFERKDENAFTGYKLVYWAGDEQGIHFMQLDVGQGLLSVLSDAVLWRSDHIDKFDHAFFLRTLTRHEDGVRLLYGTNMPSLFMLIWQHTPELVIACALWLIAWLWYRGQRFGPIVQQQITIRRSLAEHISASANYLWRGGHSKQLLAPARDEVEHQARRT